MSPSPDAPQPSKGRARNAQVGRKHAWLADVKGGDERPERDGVICSEYAQSTQFRCMLSPSLFEPYERNALVQGGRGREADFLNRQFGLPVRTKYA